MSSNFAQLKTVLFYLLGVAGVILMTTFYTAQGDLAEYAPLPTPTLEPGAVIAPSATPWPTKTPTPPLSEQDRCVLTPKAPSYAYRPDAPFTTTLRSKDASPPQLVVSGAVYASDCRTPLPGARVEVWHTDASGRYDSSENYYFRGQMQTDQNGQYRFMTIVPGRYTVAIEPLPAHVHFRVTYRDQAELFTQMHFEGDPFIRRFPYIRPGHIVALSQSSKGGDLILAGEFEIVLPVDPSQLGDGDFSSVPSD